MWTSQKNLVVCESFGYFAESLNRQEANDEYLICIRCGQCVQKEQEE